MTEPKGNGAGEMPGHEGEDTERESYAHFLVSQKDSILEKYAEYINDQTDLEEVPEWFLTARYEEGNGN